MKSIGRLVMSVALAGMAHCAMAADDNEGPPGGKNREQMREQCKANPQECREHMQEWFKKVDKDGDGSISREEAKANAPRVAEHFDEIDADHDGKVTMAELHAHHDKMRAQHRAEHGDGGGEKKQ
jgi:Ca2+-binding EF-hand superfamily protein